MKRMHAARLAVAALALAGLVAGVAAPAVPVAAAAGVDDWFVRPVTTLVAGDAASYDRLGYSAAISGDTAVIGAPGDDSSRGAAYVFVRTGTSTWAFQQKLTAFAPTISDQFGYSVAISGDTIVVGAPYTTTAMGSDSGAAEIFVRGLMGWTRQDTLTPPLGSADDQFGASVAVDGNVAVIGARNDDTYGTNAGTVDVFTRSGTTWTARQQLFAPGSQAGDEFGTAVAISGTTIVVGAPLDDTDTLMNHGSAHVYVPNSATTWAHQGTLVQPLSETDSGFGNAVAISGNTVIVGAEWDDTDAGTDRGSAHVFVRTGVSWGYQQGLWDPAGEDEDHFGCDVALEGDTAVIGAFGSDAAVGSVYFYSRSGTSWSTRQHVMMSGIPGVGLFGYSVGYSKGTAIVGSFQDDGPSMTNSGSAYVFSRFNQVFRFYNRRNGTHFYTPSPAERDHVIATWPTIYSYEGVSYLVNPENNNQPLYRFYHRRNGSHFYTASAAERDTIIATLAHVYTYEGESYRVSTAPTPTKPPVWRFYNRRNGSHFYTASEAEKNNVIATLSHTYTFEGTAFWLGQ